MTLFGGERVRRGRRAQGFTLLEALVALALIGSTGLALLAWIQQNLDSTRRVQEMQRRAAVQIEVSQYVETLNPMREPEGQIKLGHLLLKWRSQEIFARANVAHAGNFEGHFRLALYAVDVTVEDPQQLESVRFTQKVLGWRRVRAIANLD